jgi:hypothetical protein
MLIEPPFSHIHRLLTVDRVAVLFCPCVLLSVGRSVGRSVSLSRAHSLTHSLSCRLIYETMSVCLGVMGVMVSCCCSARKVLFLYVMISCLLFGLLVDPLYLAVEVSFMQLQLRFCSVCARTLVCACAN